MAEPPRKRRQVVAERRYSNPTQPSGKTPRGKPGRRAPVRRGNAVTRGVSGFIRLIWRAIFGTIWATMLTVVGIVGLGHGRRERRDENVCRAGPQQGVHWNADLMRAKRPCSW